MGSESLTAERLFSRSSQVLGLAWRDGGSHDHGSGVHTNVPDTDTIEWLRVKNNKLDNTFTIKKNKAALQDTRDTRYKMYI